MCAINGFTWEDRSLIERMNEATKHRGPDGTGVFVSPGISLGHNRLAIIDLNPRASQPMHDLQNRRMIIFNGEVYNFKELKTELADYQYRTESDTEVILAAFDHWGTKAFSRFNGMFACAIWDNDTSTLFLVRDRSGIKPLYYSLNDNKLVFSSEIKALLIAGIESHLRFDAFMRYMRLLYVPGEETILENIHRLTPGCFLKYSKGNIWIESYLPPRQSMAPKNVSAADLKTCIQKAVTRQLVSDRPLGVYLSGGLDSSIITSILAENGVRAKTFTVGFELDEAEDPKKYNADMIIARETAQFFGTDHHEVILKKDNLAERLEKSIWHMDEPVANATIIPMLFLSEFTKKDVAVALSGDGGDELFGGYERYKLNRIADYYSRLPYVVRNVISKSETFRKLNTRAGIERYVQFMFQKDDTLRTIIADEYFKEDKTKEWFKEKYFGDKNAEDFTKQFMATDENTWLVDESLLRGDKMAMTHGLEVRVPFLDTEVIDMAHSLSTASLVSPWKSKILLRESFKDVIPSNLMKQPKRGFTSPAAKWLRDPIFSAYVAQVLSRDYNPQTVKLFNWDDVAKMLKDHKSGKIYAMNTIWSILAFQIWAKQFKVKL